MKWGFYVYDSFLEIHSYVMMYHIILIMEMFLKNVLLVKQFFITIMGMSLVVKKIWCIKNVKSIFLG